MFIRLFPEISSPSPPGLELFATAVHYCSFPSYWEFRYLFIYRLIIVDYW